MAALFKVFSRFASQGNSQAALDSIQWPRSTRQTAELRTELIRDWQGVRTLEPEWNDLLRESRADSVFLTWEWVRAWEKTVVSDHAPFVITVRDSAGRLCGLAPLYHTRYTLLNHLPVRTLRIMGDYPTGSEYSDWILRRDAEPAAAQAIASELVDRSRHWDALWMPQMSGWSGARERILAACEGAGLHSLTRPSEFGNVALPGTMQEYEAALSDNRRKQFRSQRNKILVKGGCAVTRCESPAELPEYLNALFDLHARRWRALGEKGSFDSRPEQTRFYREFVPMALQKGWLWLSALRDGGAIKAVQLGYVYNDVFHQVQEGFDPEYTSGVGNVLRYEVIRECIEAGVKEYDFLGGFTEHKRRWQAEQRLGCDLYILKPGLVTRALFAAKVWPTGRFLKPAT